MAFEGVLTPEFASFAGQAGLSHSLAYQNTPKRRLHRFPSQGPQVPPPVGKPEWSAPTVNCSTAGIRGVVAIRSRPTVPPPAPPSHGAPPRRARRRGAGARTALSAGGASLPNVIHWGWRGAPAPSNPRPGRAPPCPSITPAAPFSLSHDGGLDGVRSDSDGAGVRGRVGRVARQGAGCWWCEPSLLASEPV